jgi:hypothetical protein
VIWEPFILALVLGIIVSAGLYFAYLWEAPASVDDEPAPAPIAPDPIAPDPIAQDPIAPVPIAPVPETPSSAS